MSIDYNEKIPNNVDIADDRKLRRALENWQPAYLKWWENLGPAESANYDVYLRTAISVDEGGWAHYGAPAYPLPLPVRIFSFCTVLRFAALAYVGI